MRYRSIVLKSEGVGAQRCLSLTSQMFAGEPEGPHAQSSTQFQRVSALCSLIKRVRSKSSVNMPMYLSEFITRGCRPDIFECESPALDEEFLDEPRMNTPTS